MAPLDTQSWRDDVTPEQPSGPSLEFEADFSGLERAAQGRPEQQYGDTVIPAEEPDWREVEAQAASLLERTRDLRVLAHLAVARLQLHAVPGFASVTSLIRYQLESHWDSVHPQLDPEDDNDPTLRANALLRLADPARVMRVLRDLPLAASARAGAVSWRDMAATLGMIELEAGRNKLTEAAIRAAFADTDAARLEQTRAALTSAAEDIAAIPAAFDRHAGPGSGPDFGELQKLLRDMRRLADRFIIVVEPAPEPVEVAPEEVAAVDSVMPQRQGPAAPATLGPVTTRAEAIRLLELVCAYYQRYEPSSPLPLLIERARRLADKDFMEILRDLAPDGLSQAQRIAGTDE